MVCQMSFVEHPVFIVGVGTDVLSLVRIFGAKGVPCWVCSSQRVPGTVSRYARYWRTPDPRRDAEGMIDEIVRLARRVGGRPVIFTGCDQHAQALALHRERLREVAIPCITSSQLVEFFNHKRLFSDWAQVHVPSFPGSVPATEFDPAGPIRFPVVAKPNHRGFADAEKLGLPSEEELHDRRFTLISDSKEWEEYRRQEQDYLPHLLIQEFIVGTSASKYSVCIYADRHSAIRAMFVGRRLRGFPALYGDASLVQSDEVPESVIAEVRRIVNELQYTGIAEIEFNRHAVTGEYQLMEVNPRCWGWIGITADTDCNIPWIAYQDLTGKQIPTMARGPKPGAAKMLYLIMDMANVFLRYRRDYPQWVMSPAAWWKSLKADKQVIWELDHHDLRGSIWCVLVVASTALRYVFRGSLRRLCSKEVPGDAL